jgi:FhuF 2Fe-2S C-terminal domain
MPEELVSRQSSVAGGSVDVADALASIAEELGTDRLDVCGQRLCELRAWELAAEAGPEILAGESESDLVSRVVAELGPLVERVNELSRRPRSALWRGAGDRVAQALVLAGEERGDAEVELLQVRNGCCLWHRVPGEPKCSSCPLLDPGERVARLVAEREESG